MTVSGLEPLNPYLFGSRTIDSHHTQEELSLARFGVRFGYTPGNRKHAKLNPVHVPELVVQLDDNLPGWWCAPVLLKSGLLNLAD